MKKKFNAYIQKNPNLFIKALVHKRDKERLDTITQNLETETLINFYKHFHETGQQGPINRLYLLKKHKSLSAYFNLRDKYNPHITFWEKLISYLGNGDKQQGRMIYDQYYQSLKKKCLKLIKNPEIKNLLKQDFLKSEDLCN